MATEIVGVTNLKGGVGKTTVTQNLAVALASEGCRVLVVDMDPQANLSEGFGMSGWESSYKNHYVYHVLSGEKRIHEVTICREGVDIVPSRLDLAIDQVSLEHLPGRDLLLQKALKKLIDGGGIEYDWVFIDSPPQMGLLSQNVLAASQSLLVPVESEYYSLYGMGLLETTVGRFRDFLSPDLAIKAIVLTRHDPRKQLHQQVEAQLREVYPNTLYDTYVRENVAISEASSQGQSVLSHDPKCNGSQDYLSLAREWIGRHGKKAA